LRPQEIRADVAHVDGLGEVIPNLAMWPSVKLNISSMDNVIATPQRL
jgi:hypothetical protein